jgi:hypothetical protein
MPNDSHRLQCSCGSPKLEIPSRPNSTDIITCLDCGAAGAYGEVIDQSIRQREQKLFEALQRAGFK